MHLDYIVSRCNFNLHADLSSCDVHINVLHVTRYTYVTRKNSACDVIMLNCIELICRKYWYVVTSVVDYCPYSMWNRIYETVERPSVCLSVRLSIGVNATGVASRDPPIFDLQGSSCVDDPPLIF